MSRWIWVREETRDITVHVHCNIYCIYCGRSQNGAGRGAPDEEPSYQNIMYLGKKPRAVALNHWEIQNSAIYLRHMHERPLPHIIPAIIPVLIHILLHAVLLHLHPHDP